MLRLELRTFVHPLVRVSPHSIQKLVATVLLVVLCVDLNALQRAFPLFNSLLFVCPFQNWFACKFGVFLVLIFRPANSKIGGFLVLRNCFSPADGFSPIGKGDRDDAS